MTNKLPDPKRGDECADDSGPIRCMAVADGYVMARRPGCVPFILTVKDWTRKAAMQPVPAGMQIASIVRDGSTDTLNN